MERLEHQGLGPVGQKQDSQETSQLAAKGQGVTTGPGPRGQPGRQVERWHRPGLGTGEEQAGAGKSWGLGLEERLKQKRAERRQGCQETLVLPGQPLLMSQQDREGLLREEGASPGSGDKLPQEAQQKKAGEWGLLPGEMP